MDFNFNKRMFLDISSYSNISYCNNQNISGDELDDDNINITEVPSRSYFCDYFGSRYGVNMPKDMIWDTIIHHDTPIKYSLNLLDYNRFIGTLSMFSQYERKFSEPLFTVKSLYIKEEIFDRKHVKFNKLIVEPEITIVTGIQCYQLFMDFYSSLNSIEPFFEKVYFDNSFVSNSSCKENADVDFITSISEFRDIYNIFLNMLNNASKRGFFKIERRFE